MRKIKKFIKKLVANALPIFQLIILVVIFIVIFKIDGVQLLERFYDKEALGLENLKYYIVMKLGNIAVALLLDGYILFKFRQFNKEKVFNKGNVYHNYPYIWFFVGSKILGYGKCTLKLVPIYLQFKLVLKDTFDEYLIGSDEDYPKIENETIEVKKDNMPVQFDEVNLVFSDTYLVKQNQLPINKKSLPTIFILRDNNDNNRYYSDMFIKKIVQEVRNLPEDININIFATTNPKHTKCIVEQAFKLADRGNINKLYVFKQESTANRMFKEKGVKVYQN